MAELARAEVVLEGTDAPLRRSLAGASAQMKSVGKSLQRTSDKVRKKFTTLEDSTISLRKGFAVLAGATGAAFAAKQLFDMGSAVEETANKFDVVMGPSADRARRRIIELTETIPMMQSEMEGLASGIQDLLVPLGLVRSEAADMSVEMVKVAGDLASFNNVAAEVPLEAIKSALAGMSRPLRQFGVDVSQTRLETLALNEGLIQQGEELDNAARAQAVMRAIVLDSSDAMGDAARTADSAANMMRFLIRDTKQAAENFSVALIPALQAVVGEMGDGASRVGMFSERLQEQSSVIRAWGIFAVETFKTVAQAIAAPVRIAFNLGQVIGRVLVAAAQAMTGNFEGARETLGDMVGDFGDMRDSITSVIDGFDDMRVASGLAWQTTASGAKEAADATRDAASAAREAAEASGVQLSPLPEGGVQDRFLVGGLSQRGLVPDSMVQSSLDNLSEVGRAMAEAGGTAREVAGSVASNFESAFASLVTGAQTFGEAFKNLATAVLNDLARMIARAIAFRVVMGIFSGGAGSFTGLNAGGVLNGLPGRQHGGPVSPNRSFLVGERGPELFVPSTAGSIVPNNQMGGDPGAVASAILSQLGPRPQPMSPREVALDSWYRELHALLTEDYEERR